MTNPVISRLARHGELTSGQQHLLVDDGYRDEVGLRDQLCPTVRTRLLGQLTHLDADVAARLVADAGPDDLDVAVDAGLRAAPAVQAAVSNLHFDGAHARTLAARRLGGDAVRALLAHPQHGHWALPLLDTPTLVERAADFSDDQLDEVADALDHTPGMRVRVLGGVDHAQMRAVAVRLVPAVARRPSLAALLDARSAKVRADHPAHAAQGRHLLAVAGDLLASAPVPLHRASQSLHDLTGMDVKAVAEHVLTMPNVERTSCPDWRGLDADALADWVAQVPTAATLRLCAADLHGHPAATRLDLDVLHNTLAATVGPAGAEQAIRAAGFVAADTWVPAPPPARPVQEPSVARRLSRAAVAQRGDVDELLAPLVGLLGEDPAAWAAATRLVEQVELRTLTTAALVDLVANTVGRAQPPAEAA